ERAEEIWRVVFRGHDFGLDQLVFGVPPTPIPEPSTGVLAGFGLALLVLARSAGARARRGPRG
ncbi:MAG TPA: hypothetical protein VHQ66_01350, partial [Myxococcota bacterium]|nr:hypothetical protein [Myxococcota bacterium]